MATVDSLFLAEVTLPSLIHGLISTAGPGSVLVYTAAFSAYDSYLASCFYWFLLFNNSPYARAGCSDYFFCRHLRALSVLASNMRLAFYTVHTVFVGISSRVAASSLASAGRAIVVRLTSLSELADSFAGDHDLDNEVY